MTKRALVIGAQVHGLSGVEHDTRRMRAVLEARGFAVDARLGPDASRRGILDGIERLAASLTADDAAVFYFSGHGAYASSNDPRAGTAARPDLPRRLQFIVPTDYDAGDSGGEFHGITSWELSLRMADLTDRSRNVTVILDCCHAAQMSRDAAARRALPRALPYPQRVGLEAYLQLLRDHGERFERLAPEGNPHAVRLFACEENQSAFEYTNDTGVRGGAFTEAIADFLTEIGDAPIAWAALGRAIRERVQRLFPDQQPDFGGPIARDVFSLHQPSVTRAVPVIADGGRARIRAGRITGVNEGDVYGVMPVSATAHDSRGQLSRATVTRVNALDAEVVLAPAVALPDGAVAFPLEQSLPRHAVRVVGAGSRLGEVIDAVTRAPRLRVAGPDEATMATVRVSDDAIAISDGIGDLITPLPWADAPSTARELAIDFLNDLAVARSLAAIESQGLPSSCAVVEWGVVVDGKPVAQDEHNALLGLGDRIYVRIENRSDRDAFVHIFNVGVRGKVTRLTASAALGVAVRAGDSYTLGTVDGKGLVGLGLTWPDGLPRDTPRRDSLLVIATSVRVDLGVFETQQQLTRSAVSRGDGSLRQLLAQVHKGGTRDAGLDHAPDTFLVVRRSFELNPRPGTLALPELEFLVDENPHGTRSALTPQAWRPASVPIVRKAAVADAGTVIAAGAPPVTRSGAGAGSPQAAPARPMPVPAPGPSPAPAPSPAPSGPLAIRLAELVVHSNRALGSAGIRVDVLVCTRTPPGAQPYLVQTLHVPRVNDGDTLPIDNVLLYHGEVHDFVDLCVWVSRDTKGGQALVDLLSKEASSPELQQATAALITTAGVSGGWIGAVGASAVLTRIAYGVLVAAAGTSIGLYRTSFLASEQFGLGRHPPTGLRRAQDFSFAIEVVRNAARP